MWNVLCLFYIQGRQTWNCISFLLSFISTVVLVNATLSLGEPRHSSEVLCNWAPWGTISSEHVMSTVFSAGSSRARTALKLPLGARMKPAGGRIRNGATSIANVTGGPVREGTVTTRYHIHVKWFSRMAAKNGSIRDFSRDFLLIVLNLFWILKVSVSVKRKLLSSFPFYFGMSIPLIKGWCDVSRFFTDLIKCRCRCDLQVSIDSAVKITGTLVRNFEKNHRKVLEFRFVAWLKFIFIPKKYQY